MGRTYGRKDFIDGKKALPLALSDKAIHRIRNLRTAGHFLWEHSRWVALAIGLVPSILLGTLDIFGNV